MKIIHAFFSFNVGGAETMLVDIINQQCKEASVYLIIINDKVNTDLLNTIDNRVKVYLTGRKENDKIYSYQSHALSAFRIWEDTKTTQGGIRFIQNTRQVLVQQGAKRFSKAKFHLLYIACKIWAGKIKRQIMFISE